VHERRVTSPQSLDVLLSRGSGALIPGAANALTARVIEDAGFQALLVTGAGLANTYLGVPDLGLTTATEVIEHVARIRDAVELPIIADADTGFGNAVNVYRTVRDLERAGANAIQLEDQVFPKRCGHFNGKSVIPTLEMSKKLQAAVEARRSQRTLIIARTDAYAEEGLDGALERAALYKEAGADILFVEAPQTEDELRRIPAAVSGLHLCNIVYGGKTPLLAREKLMEMGFAGIIYANVALQASLLAMKDVLAHLRSTGSLVGKEQSLISFAERQRAVDFDWFQNFESRFKV
jgi:2-methylisocitrate lyase-like PEP mutase family enzyme